MYTTLAEKVDPKHTALIVVDVQNDFCHEDSPYTAGRGDLGPIQAAARRLNTLIERARNAGALVVFIQNVTRPGSRTEVQLEHTLRTGTNSDPGQSICLEGSWGSQFYVVSPTDKDLVVQKIRYSAFIRQVSKRCSRSAGLKRWS